MLLFKRKNFFERTYNLGGLPGLHLGIDSIASYITEAWTDTPPICK